MAPLAERHQSLLTPLANERKETRNMSPKIPTKTGGASSLPSSFQNFTLRKNISALPFCTSPQSASLQHYNQKKIIKEKLTATSSKRFKL